jgi:hypothetical protein
MTGRIYLISFRITIKFITSFSVSSILSVFTRSAIREITRV